MTKQLLLFSIALVFSSFIYSQKTILLAADYIAANNLAPRNYTEAQPYKGVVTGDDNKPLAGVTVSVKGTNKKTATDKNGAFVIEANEGDVLIFTYIGFGEKQVTLGAETEVIVALKQSEAQLNEVVVTALGIQKQKRSLGYSTTEVKGGELTQSREVNLANALSGKVAGVSVAGTATGPYGSSRITIRGNASLQGNNQPLYVIDGIPFSNGNEGSSGQWGGADYGDPLSTINPDDIETIQVLKGVAASALYGYRGGNGAILITTKNGSRSRGVGVELNNNLTATSVIDERDYQYAYGQGTQGIKPTTTDAANGVGQSSWGAKLDGSDAINFLGDTYKYVAQKDNFKNFYKTGINNQASLSVSGSSDKVSYRLGISDLYLETNVPNSNMKNQGLNLNTTYNVTKNLSATVTANYTFETVKNRASFSDAPGNVLAAALYLPTSFDIRWLKPQTIANGDELLPGSVDPYFENPYFIAYKYQNSTSRERLTGSITLKYKFTDWLSLQGQVARDGNKFDLINITPNGVSYSNNDGGAMTQSTSNTHELNANYMIEFNKQFNDFTVHANAGSNYQDDIYQSSNFSGGPFNVPYFYSASNISNKPFNYDYSHYRVNSVYGAVDLGYKNYLFLSGTARNDWFSTLNPKTNSYLYPSVSASFVFSDALHLPSWISFGKLRASYAYSSGGTDPYQNLLTYGLNGYTLNGQPVGYVNQTDIPNNFLKPIKIAEDELGLNMQFLNNRVGFDVAIYNKKTTDDIVNVTISPTSGYTGNIVNIGSLRNRGLELLLNGTPFKTKDFSWDASFNIAFNSNKVLALAPGLDNVVIDGAYPRWGDEVSIQNIVGKPYAQIVGYAYKRDANGKKIFDTAGLPERTDDPVALGSGIYKTTGGFNNDFHYKGFTLSVLFDFKYGAKIYSGTNLLLYNNGLQKTTLNGRGENGVIGDGVTEDGKANTKAVNSQIYYQDLATSSDHHVSEEFVYDASFIKLRALSIGYSLPSGILKNSFIKGVTFSLVGRNIATLMKHTPNIDPESNLNGTNGQGLELSGYPSIRSVGFNLNVKF